MAYTATVPHAIRPDPVVTVRTAQTNWALNTDPTLALANAAQWGMLAITTFHRLGVCTSVMEVSRVDIDAERVMLCGGGTQAVQLRRQPGLRGHAGTPLQGQTLDWSFTLDFNDAHDEPVMTIAVLNPMCLDNVIDSLRGHAKNTQRDHAHLCASTPQSSHVIGHHVGHGHGPSTLPAHLAITPLLSCRDEHDALSLDLHSPSVRHRYIGPVQLARRCTGLASQPHYQGDGMTLQLSPAAIHSVRTHTWLDGTPGVSVHSLGNEHLSISPASGSEFAAWWAAQALPKT